MVSTQSQKYLNIFLESLKKVSSNFVVQCKFMFCIINLNLLFSEKHYEDLESEDDGYEDEDQLHCSFKSNPIETNASKTSCYLAIVDGELYGHCAPDGMGIFHFINFQEFEIIKMIISKENLGSRPM